MNVTILELWTAKLPPEPERTWEGKTFPARPAREATFCLVEADGGTRNVIDLDVTRMGAAPKIGARIDIQCKTWPDRELRATATGRPVK